MKDREEAKKENLRDYIKKDTKSQNAHSKNQIIQSVEESAINESVFETKKSEYYGVKSE
ncbi:hypothetical protein [Clostridium sp. FP1]|uniref:hypothetical protein n=1 Tax=Clostridium sp. FP1 TaxID=2724076 RepID=UPI0013E97DDB|nr:hypothetical protein [Clostridium sp. FP1]MBZ9636423.1 hypothetical protein [Clostridium sp. FP1]